MLSRDRPDPDALLRSLQNEEERRGQGKLKIFLGASAGVGKTFAMLSEAREQLARGVDVVIGYAETHSRAETEALVVGLDQISLREIDYKGVKLKEFDLDGAIARKPSLVLVDELAHTNAPGSRHHKRWQDIEELLRSGIDVYTAVNIQHLESLNDVVAQITGVQVKETVPDAFVERADNIEVIDIPPEELQQRLVEGKVYVPERIEKALEGFFQKGNLIALREMALRRAADRVDAQMQSYRNEQGIGGLWPARERVLVCIAPNNLANKVVRAAARIGAASHAEMFAVYVESDRQARRAADDQSRAREALSLADDLGMHTITLSGHDIVAEIIQYARQRNVNLIVVGKPVKARWKELLFGSVVDELVRRSGEIDVHVLTSFEEEKPQRISRGRPLKSGSVTGYAVSVATTAVATVICALIHSRFELSNLIMVYLAGVVFVSTRYGIRESILASLLSVAAFDLLFVPPQGTFAVSDAQYIVTFAVMLAVALLISTLGARLRNQAVASAERERRNAALYTLSKELSKSRSKREIATAAVKEIREVFGADAAVLIWDERLIAMAPSASGFEREPNEMSVAAWCFQHNEVAGKDTETLPNSTGYYVPLRGASSAVGVLAILPGRDTWPLLPTQLNLLETFANSVAVALERAILAKESHEARLTAESEKMRNALLSSISHDLRTPLTSIAGAASALRDQQGDVAQLSETIYEEAMRLNLQVQNLLDMTRLQSGLIQPRLEWHSLEEIVGSSIRKTAEVLGEREVTVSLPGDLPLIRVDQELMEKVFTNLLENAAKHTPGGTPVEILARNGSERVFVEISDRGPGIPKGQESEIFERFAQLQNGESQSGFGLGLAICRTVMRLHEGRVWAKGREGGGAVFVVEIPKQPGAPEVPRG